MNHPEFNHYRAKSLISLILVILFVLLFLYLPVQGQSQDISVIFNHQTHAKEYEISCRFCHYYADRSAQAGVPSLNDCMGCHPLIRGSDEASRLEIRKFEEIQLFKQSLEWLRINDLPDFVFFSHQSHTSKGFECESCHGDVASQESPTASGKIEDLSMKWCMDCHVKKHPLGPDKKVLTQKHESVLQLESSGSQLQGTTECHSCHK